MRFWKYFKKLEKMQCFVCFVNISYKNFFPLLLFSQNFLLFIPQQAFLLINVYTKSKYEYHIHICQSYVCFFSSLKFFFNQKMYIIKYVFFPCGTYLISFITQSFQFRIDLFDLKKKCYAYQTTAATKLNAGIEIACRISSCVTRYIISQ